MKIAHPPMQDYSRVSLRQNEVQEAARVDCDDLRLENEDLKADAFGACSDANDWLKLRDLLSRHNAELRAFRGW